MPKLTTAAAFDVCDENLKLDPKERIAAEVLHNEVTELLRGSGIIVAAFLQGSFARKTMIPPLRDIDKIVLLSEAMRGLSPDTVMDRIESAIRMRYPEATFERSRHALKVDFGKTVFSFDIVPAWETDTDDDDVLIANRETGSWDRSNSRTLIRVIAERNTEVDGLFIHQVRMGRQAARNLVGDAIPGLHVESWAFTEITAVLPHDEACARILSAGARLLGDNYTDPTGVDVISARLKPDEVAYAKPILTAAAQNAAHALELAEAGRHQAAIRLWRDILGDCFPEPSPDDAVAIRSSFLATPAATTHHAVRAKPVRSWRP